MLGCCCLTGNDEEYRRLCQRLSAQVRRNGRRGHGVLAGVHLHGWSAIGHRACENRTLGRTGGCRVAYPDVSLCPRRRQLPGGPYERAVECLEESNARWGTQRTPHNPFLLAMAYHRLGQHEKSRECYRIGIEVLRSRTPPRGSEDPAAGSLWDDGGLIRVDALEPHAPRGQGTPWVERRTGSANRERPQAPRR